MSNSKYGDLIRQARKPESQETREPESQKARKPESQPTKEPDNQKARKPENQKTRKSESQKAREPEEEVNLCVKVPKSLRRHWAGESKRTGVTMTSVIIEALKTRFGEPD
ncbi:hypothetical protein H6F74_28545 [Trichocoleus sp. FACHB-90]|uniref:hypothetical protein n=1 Tax=Cyanophyceae TaxID=3028117 RepID=UPI001686D55D|nr:hypothetical protein [Trichocoleus sp. FACHB-90]MBD1930140.1 hypothetical protein [Trichocoleus sp. FACHB-90]